VHAVFLVAVPLALAALLTVLALREVPLRGPAGPSRTTTAGDATATGSPATAQATR